MDQRNKKAPAQKRPVPSDKPRDRSDEPRRDPFPGVSRGKFRFPILQVT